MLGIDRFKKYVYLLANFEQTGGAFPEEKFNIVTPEQAIDLIEQYYGKPKWKAMQPYLANDRDQVIKDYVSNAEVHTSALRTPSKGIIVLPADYMHLDSLEYTYFGFEEYVCGQCGSCTCACPGKRPRGFKKAFPGGTNIKRRTIKKMSEITIVGDGQWSELFHSELTVPNLEHPYARYIGSNKLEVAPHEIPQMRVAYVRYPKTPVWAFTSVNGQNVFTAAGSQDIELPPVLLKELAAMVLEAMGIHTREYWLASTAQEKAITAT
jgi:hypothetical protein